MEETFLPFPSPFSPLQKRSRPVSFHGLEHFFFCFSVTDFRREFFRFCSLFFGSRPTEFSVVFFLPPLYQVATFHFDEMKILVLVLFLFNVEAILEKTKKNVGHRKAGGYEATKKNPKEFITATFSAKTTRQTKNPKPFLGKKKEIIIADLKVGIYANRSPPFPLQRTPSFSSFLFCSLEEGGWTTVTSCSVFGGGPLEQKKASRQRAICPSSSSSSFIFTFSASSFNPPPHHHPLRGPLQEGGGGVGKISSKRFHPPRGPPDPHSTTLWSSRVRVVPVDGTIFGRLFFSFLIGFFCRSWP